MPDFRSQCQQALRLRQARRFNSTQRLAAAKRDLAAAERLIDAEGEMGPCDTTPCTVSAIETAATFWRVSPEALHGDYKVLREMLDDRARESAERKAYDATP